MNKKKIGKFVALAAIILCVVVVGVVIVFSMLNKSNIKSVEINDVEYVQYTNCIYGYKNKNITEVTYNISPDFKVTLKDGTVLESENGCLTYNGMDYSADFDFSQINQLEVGTHTIDATVMGFKTSFKVTVLESPVESVKIQDLEFIQNANGSWSEEDGVKYYDYSLPRIDFTLTLKDGTVLQSEDGFIEYKGEGYCVEYNSEFDYDNQLNLGVNTFPAYVLGYETSVNINIVESPVKSVEIQNLKCVEYSEDAVADVTPVFTVTLKDGTVLKSNDGDVEYNNIKYSVDCDLDPYYNNELGVGNHTIPASVMGFETSFILEITE